MYDKGKSLITENVENNDQNNLSFGGESYYQSLQSNVSGVPDSLNPTINETNETDSDDIQWEELKDNEEDNENNEYLLSEYNANDMVSLISFGAGKKTGTIFSGCINLSNTVMGAGILSLPYAVSQVGYGTAMILFLLFAMLTFSALHLNMAMTRCVPNASYYAFAEKMNRPKSKLVIDIAVIISMISAATSYLIIIGDVMPDFCTHFIPSTNHSNGSIFTIGGVIISQRVFWTFVFLFVLIMPSVALKKMDALRFTSLFAIFCFGFITVVMVLYNVLDSWDECAGIDKDDCKGEVMAFLDLSVAKNWLIFLKVTPFFLLAFGCAQNTLPISNEMKKRTLGRLNCVLLNMLCFVVCIYATVGASGYFTYGDKIEADILKKYPQNNITAMVRLSISIAVAFSYPLVLFPCRKSLCLLIWGREPRKLSAWKYYSVTYFIVLVTIIYAFCAGNIGIVFSLAGSTAYPIKEYIFPAYTFIVLRHDILDRDRFYKAKRKFAHVLFWFGILLIPFCLTMTFVKIS
eukprot:463767_1